MKQAINFIFGTPCENCDTRTRNKVGIKGSPIDAILCEGCLIKWIRSLKMTKNEARLFKENKPVERILYYKEDNEIVSVDLRDKPLSNAIK